MNPDTCKSQQVKRSKRELSPEILSCNMDSFLVDQDLKLAQFVVYLWPRSRVHHYRPPQGHPSILSRTGENSRLAADCRPPRDKLLNHTVGGCPRGRRTVDGGFRDRALAAESRPAESLCERNPFSARKRKGLIRAGVCCIQPAMAS